MSPAERETPAGEAMREAVAPLAEYIKTNLWRWKTNEQAAVALITSGPIASELARLTAHAECGHANADENYRRLQAAEAALTTLRADHAAEVARLTEALTWIADQMPATCDMTITHEMAERARAALAPKETTDA